MAASLATSAASQRLSAQSTCSLRAMAPLRPQQALAPGVRRARVVVRAAQLPQGVSQPPRVPQKPESMWGFVSFAEKLNSRAAMLGFFGILLVEAIAGRGIFEMAGFEVGKGLGFEF
jgi:hypothetical protein